MPKRKRFKIRSRQLVPVGRFLVPCALHPEGQHAVVLYGYARRRRSNEWWQPRWDRLRQPLPAQRFGVRSPAVNPKHIFVKFLDLRKCPFNAKADYALHRGLRALGTPTCRDFMTRAQSQAQPKPKYTRTKLKPKYPRSQEASAFLNRLFQRAFPMYKDLRLLVGYPEVVYALYEGSKRVVLSNSDADSGAPVPPAEVQAAWPCTVKAFFAYMRYFVDPR